MICKGKEGKWELASCVVVGKLWQLAGCMAASNLYIISELCDLTSCVPLASFVAVGVWAQFGADVTVAHRSCE